MSEAARAARAARPRVAVGSDHAGFEMKKTVKRALDELGYEAIDFGTDSEESTDYPADKNIQTKTHSQKNTHTNTHTKTNTQKHTHKNTHTQIHSQKHTHKLEKAQ